MVNDTLLMVFVKNLEKGKVKTRLAKTVGDDKALHVYEQLLQHTRSITEHLPCDKAVFYSNFLEENDIWNTSVFQKFVQQGNSLGERMFDAFTRSFKLGYKNIIIIGSDCYDLSEELLLEAISALQSHHSVIGPAHDGGYYLLGTNQLIPDLFINKSWSTSSLFEETMAELESLQLTTQLLTPLSDIDQENDLKNHPHLLA